MSISKKDVEHVAKLARLGLTEEEKQIFTKQLNNILGYAEKINKIDTKNIKATSSVVDLQTPYREDKVIPCDFTEDIIKNAPEKESGMFKVPRILE